MFKCAANTTLHAYKYAVTLLHVPAISSNSKFNRKNYWQCFEISALSTYRDMWTVVTQALTTTLQAMPAGSRQRCGRAVKAAAVNDISK